MKTTHATAAGPLAMLSTALVYAVAGLLALKVAIPPSYASPIFPAAGLALASALVYGRWGIAGAVLGALLVNGSLGVERQAWTLAGTLATGAVALGVGLQAAAGRWLMQWRLRAPSLLGEPEELVRFYGVVGPLGCLVSASVATAALTATGVVEPGGAGAAWLTWWVGDTLGVLIATPIALTVIGQPRAEWRRRLTVVGLPLLLACLLLGFAIARILATQEQREAIAFERDAWGLAERVESRLREPQRALLAMHSLFDTQVHIDPDEMRRAASAWLDEQPYLVAVGYSERVPRDQLAAFEARVRAEGPTLDYAVFDRPDAPEAAGESDVLAIRYIEPLAANQRALGVNQRSIPAARRAIEDLMTPGREVAATAGFRLTQATGNETGIVLYRPLLRGEPVTEAGRRAALRGLVFVTLNLQATLGDLSVHRPTIGDWCLLDPGPDAERPLLAGSAACRDGDARVHRRYERGLVLGGRPLVLRVQHHWGDPALIDDGGVRLFSIVGLLAVTLLGALLLTAAGRQRRIEAAVAERTADLEQAGQALRESEERMRSILDHVPTGVVYADNDGRVRDANPSLLGMLGLAALPEPAPRLVDWAEPADRPALQALIDDVVAGRPVPARRRLQLRTTGGAPVAVQLGLTPLRDAEGRPRRLVGVVEDIGEHLRLRASEQARERAEASSRAKSEFVGRMSHELRTPLNAMLGFGQLLARDHSPPLAPHQQRWAAQIQDAGWHLLNMINDTLDLSMIESGDLRLQPRALEPAVLLEATLPMLAAAAERRGVQLQAPEVRPDAGRLLGDETRVRQIVTNLLSNAVKYNQEGGRVAVEVVRAGESQVELRVHDTGLGLDAQQLQSLFQPFNRLGREASGVEGTGIGLVISRRLAELMGGSLTAHSEPGLGSTFVLRLPRAPDDAAPEGAAAAPARDADYHRRHVHYVEDNETNVVVMQGMLAQRPQIELTVSTLGLDALVAVRRRRPDLILLDMHLPDIDGMDLLRHLKQDDTSAAVPVLVLSADATRERIERALAEGAAGYLTKPLNLAELLAAIDEILAQQDTRWA